MPSSQNTSVTPLLFVSPRPTQQIDSPPEHATNYLSQSLIDDIINAVNTIIYRAIEAIETGLLSTPPAALGFAAEAASDSTIRDTDGDGNIEYPEARQEIEEGVHQLETLLEATVDKTFDRFEIYTLRNILTVPEELEGWIRLSHYEVRLDLSYQPCEMCPRMITAP